MQEFVFANYIRIIKKQMAIIFGLDQSSTPQWTIINNEEKGENKETSKKDLWLSKLLEHVKLIDE